MKVQLLTTLKIDRDKYLWRGAVFSSPLHPSVQRELKRNRGKVKILEMDSPEEMIETKPPIPTPLPEPEPFIEEDDSDDVVEEVPKKVAKKPVKVRKF